MILKAPGKINLAINVLEKRDDGYHNVDMISVPIGLHDHVEITELVQGNETFLTCDDIELVCDESNLALKAYKAMQENFQIKKPYRIEIYKRIPIEAGLAGGSADAAAVIKAVAHYHKPTISLERLLEVGETVGSDVSFCLLNKPCRVQGRGEILTPIKIKENYHVLIVKPKKGLSTKVVYERADLIEKVHPNIDLLIKGLEEGNEKIITENMVNSLQNAAIEMCPDVREIILSLKQMGFDMCSMSGSGSACFALSKDVKALQYASKFFASKGYLTYLTSFNI